MLTTVASFAEPWSAHILRGRLEAEGIFVLIVDELQVGLNWPWALALGGAKVQVPAEHYDAAIEVARLGLAGDYRRELEPVFGPLDDEPCPNCRSANIRHRRSIPRLVLQGLLYWHWGIIVPLTARVHRCRACGTKWRDRFG